MEEWELGIENWKLEYDQNGINAHHFKLFRCNIPSLPPKFKSLTLSYFILLN